MNNTAASATTTCTKADPQPSTAAKVYGDYKVASIIDSGSNSLSLTGATGNTFKLEQPFVVAAAGEQTAKQTIEGDTKTFTIKMTSGEVAPKFYPGNEASTVAFSSCTLSSTTVTCTPTSTELTKDKETTIYYKKPCETTFTDTGIKVTYKGATDPSSASAFMTISKITLILGFLLL